MKVFRKVFFFILAILPVVSLIFTLVFGFATLRSDQISAESVNIYDIFDLTQVSPVILTRESDDIFTITTAYVGSSDSGLIYKPFTFLDTVFLRPLSYFYDVNLEGSVTSVYGTNVLFGLPYLLQNAGFTMNTFSIFVCYYFVYMFIVVFAGMIWELITFIPRKCIRLFEKGADL